MFTLAMKSAMFLVSPCLRFDNSRRRSTSRVFRSTSSIPNESKNSFFNASKFSLIAGGCLLYHSFAFPSKLLQNKIRCVSDMSSALSVLFAGSSAFCSRLCIQLSYSKNSLGFYIPFSRPLNIRILTDILTFFPRVVASGLVTWVVGNFRDS